MTCDECRTPLRIFAVVDSEDWEAIARGAYALCPECMDRRFADSRMTVDCELQLIGGSGSMRSVKTPRIVRAGAWRPATGASGGLPTLYRDKK